MSLKKKSHHFAHFASLSKALEEKLRRRTDRMQQLEAANVEFQDKYT